MQNKQAVVGIVAAVLILVGAGAVYTLGKTKNAPEPTSIAKSVTPTPSGSMQASVAGIFKSTKNQKCEFDTKTENGETKGTIYATPDKAYGQIFTTAAGKTQSISVIRNEDAFYVWGDAFPQGIKMTMSVEEMGQKITGSQFANFDPNHKTDFTCVGWTPDELMFSPPTNVKFVDLGGSMSVTGGQTKTTGTPSSQCSLCNSMTGQAKTACLSSFHCK